MSWLFSRALVAAYANSHSLPGLAAAFSAGTCSDGEPSAQLNVMPTPHKFWRNDKTMEPSDLSQFGLTCAVLTADRGEELLTWFREGFPVRTSVQRAKAPVWPAQGLGCGLRWRASWVKYDRDSSSWRTHQYSLLGGLESFSETWPRSGLMLHGECFPPQIVMPTMNGSDYGLLPTIRKSDGERGGRGDLLQAVKGHPNKHFRMPTMTLVSAKHPGRVKRKAHQQTSLSQEVNRAASVPGQLNPRWVEWFMGWPESWTSLAGWEMAKFHEWQQQHSPRLPVNLSEAA